MCAQALPPFPARPARRAVCCNKYAPRPAPPNRKSRPAPAGCAKKCPLPCSVPRAAPSGAPFPGALTGAGMHRNAREAPRAVFFSPPFFTFSSAASAQPSLHLKVPAPFIPSALCGVHRKKHCARPGGRRGFIKGVFAISFCMCGAAAIHGATAPCRAVQAPGRPFRFARGGLFSCWAFSCCRNAGLFPRKEKGRPRMGRRDKKFVAGEEMYSPSGFLKQRPERRVDIRKHCL